MFVSWYFVPELFSADFFLLVVFFGSRCEIWDLEGTGEREGVYVCRFALVLCFELLNSNSSIITNASSGQRAQD